MVTFHEIAVRRGEKMNAEICEFGVTSKMSLFVIIIMEWNNEEDWNFVDCLIFFFFVSVIFSHTQFC